MQTTGFNFNLVTGIKSVQFVASNFFSKTSSLVKLLKVRAYYFVIVYCKQDRSSYENQIIASKFTG